MKHFWPGVLLFLFAAGANAQSKADVEAVRKLPPSFCEAWAKHDGHALAKIMADDVDFVTVATTYLHGRADFEKFHTRLLSGRFKDSTNTVLHHREVPSPRHGSGSLELRRSSTIGAWMGPCVPSRVTA